MNNNKISKLNTITVPKTNVSNRVLSLKKSIDKIDKPVLLCEVSQNNCYHLAIIHCNSKFTDCFHLNVKQVLGKSYDFLFQDMEIDYNSDNQEQYTQLLKAVRDFQPITVNIDIPNFKGKSKSNNFRILFNPNDFNGKHLYCFFTFEKVEKTKGRPKNNQNTKPRILITNLARALRNEKMLHKVSNIIVSDCSIKEIAENISKILCEYLKVDRCILHDYNDGRTGFLVEYCNKFANPLLGDEKEKGQKDLVPITRYINFQNQIFEDLNLSKGYNNTMVCENISNDPRFKEIEDICSKFSIVSQLSMVITLNGKVNGGLYIHQASSRKWLLEEVDLVEMIAGQFSIAVDRSYAIDKVMVTNHQLLEKTLELKKTLKEEKRMRKMQNEFIAMVSHEFKTPLQIIDSTRELLFRKLHKILTPDENNIVVKHLNKIRVSINRMNGLIQSTFSLSKIEMNKGIEIDRKDFDIKYLIKDVLDKSHNLVLDKNVEVKLEIDGLPDIYNGDQKLLDHCFTNVLANAIKYSKKDSIVKIIGGVEGKNIFIKIVDHGIGIPKKDLKKIGQKFFRAENTLAVPGTGIGLYLTNYFADLHNGFIKIDSELDVGTTVSVLLPVEIP